jgi:hypothetical protein
MTKTVWLLLLVVTGCAHKRVVGPPLPLVSEARAYVAGIASNMALWDADLVGEYERAEIARVKMDIAAANRESDTVGFLTAAAKLHIDWNTLLALDERLKRHGIA